MPGRPRSQNTNTNTVHTVFPGARTTVPWGGRLSTGAVLFPSRGVHCSECPVLSSYVFQCHFSRGSYPELGKPDSVQRPLRARLPLSVLLGSPPSKGSTPFTSLSPHPFFPPAPTHSSRLLFHPPVSQGVAPTSRRESGFGRVDFRAVCQMSKVEKGCTFRSQHWGEGQIEEINPRFGLQ